MIITRIHIYIAVILMIVAMLLLNNGCNRKDRKLPDYILDKQQMISLITDIHLTESALAQKQSQGAVVTDMALVYYDSLLVKHSVTKAQIDSSLLYYSRRPELFEDIYRQVITQLSKKENEIAEKKDQQSDTLALQQPEPPPEPENDTTKHVKPDTIHESIREQPMY